MKSKGRLIICLIIFCLALTGCYDAIEIDDEIFVISIGIDKGVTNKIRLSVQYATYTGSSGGSSGGSGSGQKGGGSGMSSSNKQSGSNVHTIECPTILEGIDMLGMAISRRVSLMHAKMVVFSEEFAQDGVGIYVAPIERYRETRGSMATVVVKGTAEDFLKENQTFIGGTISKAVELMFLQAKYSNYFPYIQFHDFYENMISPYQQAIAIYGGVNDFKKLPDEKDKGAPLKVQEGFEPGELPRRGVAKREFAGIAVFDGDKMVGSLDSYETTYYMMLMGEFPTGAVTYEDPNQPGKAIIFDLRNSRKPTIKAYLKNGKPVIDIALRMEADIESIQSRINYEKAENLTALNDLIGKSLKKKMSDIIRKTQVEFKSDIFGYGRYMAGNFNTIQEWEQYNWLSHFPEAQVNLDVTVNIRRAGLMVKSTPIWTSEGTEKIKEPGK